MTVCIRCHRALKQPTATGMGPVCARVAKAQAPEQHERDLFGYDPAKAAIAAQQRLAVQAASAAAAGQAGVRAQARDARARLDAIRFEPVVWSIPDAVASVAQPAWWERWAENFGKVLAARPDPFESGL